MSISLSSEASSVVQVLQLQHYCQLAALIITFYDHVITFDQEIELIWRKRWSKSKVLYFLCRYIGNTLIFWETYVYLNQHPTDKGMGPISSCLWGIRIISSVAITCTWITQLIMQFRIQAIYNSKILSGFLSAVFVGEVVGLITLGFLAMHGMEVTSQPFPGVYQCTCVKFPSYAFMFWVPILFFDTLLFLLAVGLAFISWRRRPEDPTPRWYGPSLVDILLRDNFGYFFSAFGIYLATTIIWITAPTRYVSIPSCFSYSITTVMGSRLILNLCDAYHNPSKYASRGTSEWDTRSHWASSSKPSIGFMANTANGALEATAVPVQAHSQSEIGVLEGSVHVEMRVISNYIEHTKDVSDHGQALSTGALKEPAPNTEV